MSSGPPPAIPPRSHLRALAASGGCVPSHSASTSPSTTATRPRTEAPPTAASRAQQPRQSSTYTRPSLQASQTASSSSLQYVLDVEVPSSAFTPPLTRQASEHDERAEAAEVISFKGHYKRKASAEGGVMNPLSGSGDPFRIRDAKPARKPSSGVYTPKTFPGAQGQSTSPGRTSTSTFSAPTSPYPYTPRAPAHNSNARARSLSGLKRFSMANLKEAQKVPPVPAAPARRSLSGETSRHAHRSSLTHAPAPQLSVSSHATHYVPGGSHSPSSDGGFSAGSASPPATPTTPISARGYLAQNGVVVIGKDSDDCQSFDSRDTLDVGMDAFSKVVQKDDTTASSIAESIPMSDRSTPIPLSPDAPKRARRKPVPCLIEDDIVKRLDAIEV